MSGRFLLFPPFSSLTAIRFIDRILYPIARPFAGATGTLFLLMNDNASSHRANILNLEAFWENGISFDVTRPQSYWTPQPYWTSQPYGTSQPYWTCLGFSKEAYSAMGSCSIQYQWTWSCFVNGMRSQCSKDGPFTYSKFPKAVHGCYSNTKGHPKY